MKDRQPFPHEVLLAPSSIDLYTPEIIKKLEFTNEIQDSLSLLRYGVLELEEMNGKALTEKLMSGYTVDGLLLDWQKNHQYNPFLLVARNSRDGVVGVLEGQTTNFLYKLTGKEEQALWISTVVIRDHGTNDEDAYSYRGKHDQYPLEFQVSKFLYRKVDEIAKRRKLRLIAAGVNNDNISSIAFHERNGFSVKRSVFHKSHPTFDGAFIPSVILEQTPKGRKIASVFTKRLDY